ncbi:unnamed protein product, partial [Laminaria digitata]
FASVPLPRRLAASVVATIVLCSASVPSRRVSISSGTRYERRGGGHGTMVGSDSDGEAPVSQADLATFRQEMANEVAQLQAVLTKAVKGMVDATRPSAPGRGSDGAGRLGSQHGSSAAGASLLG